MLAIKKLLSIVISISMVCAGITHLFSYQMLAVPGESDIGRISGPSQRTKKVQQPVKKIAETLNVSTSGLHAGVLEDIIPSVLCHVIDENLPHFNFITLDGRYMLAVFIALAHCGWNYKKAAKMLGKPVTLLYKYIQRYNLANLKHLIPEIKYLSVAIDEEKQILKIDNIKSTAYLQAYALTNNITEHKFKVMGQLLGVNSITAQKWVKDHRQLLQKHEDNLYQRINEEVLLLNEFTSCKEDEATSIDLHNILKKCEEFAGIKAETVWQDALGFKDILIHPGFIIGNWDKGIKVPQVMKDEKEYYFFQKPISNIGRFWFDLEEFMIDYLAPNALDENSDMNILCLLIANILLENLDDVFKRLETQVAGCVKRNPLGTEILDSRSKRIFSAIKQRLITLHVMHSIAFNQAAKKSGFDEKEVTSRMNALRKDIIFKPLGNDSYLAFEEKKVQPPDMWFVWILAQREKGRKMKLAVKWRKRKIEWRQSQAQQERKQPGEGNNKKRIELLEQKIKKNVGSFISLTIYTYTEEQTLKNKRNYINTLLKKLKKLGGTVFAEQQEALLNDYFERNVKQIRANKKVPKSTGDTETDALINKLIRLPFQPLTKEKYVESLKRMADFTPVTLVQALTKGDKMIDPSLARDALVRILQNAHMPQPGDINSAVRALEKTSRSQ